MTRKMIINAIDVEEVRIAILKDRVLEDFDIETRSVEKNKGNIYIGQVMAVEPALNAAFVNYGADKQGFLTAHDVHPKYAEQKPAGETFPKIDDLLRPKQTVVVQIAKDEVGAKGAVLTTYLSLAGRYLVLMPDSQTQGVSRKIDDEEVRLRVRTAAAKLNVPDQMGVIIRTAGHDRTRVELNRDLKVLLRLWDNIQKEAAEAQAPALIFKEQDVIIRALRDYFCAEIDEIVLDSDEAYDRAAEYMHMVMPQQTSALTRYVERRPIFHHYRVEEQLDLIYAPKVILPSGGSIVVEPTEALVAIDVNSGRQKSSNQEDTATQTNTEAAIEVARQLRLRDLGGIIVIDFIDMMQRKNQQKVERALKEALRFDKARVKVGRIGRNGTCEITRQRIRSALQASVFARCTTCHGTGHVLNPSSHAVAVLRKVCDRASRGDLRLAKVRVESEVANRLRTKYWTALQDLERRFDLRIEIAAEHSFGSGHADFTFETNPDVQPLPIEEPNFGPAPRPDDVSVGASAGLDSMSVHDDEEDEEEAALRRLDAQDAQEAQDAAVARAAERARRQGVRRRHAVPPVDVDAAADIRARDAAPRRLRRLPHRGPAVRTGHQKEGAELQGKALFSPAQPASAASHLGGAGLSPLGDGRTGALNTLGMPTFEFVEAASIPSLSPPGKRRRAAYADEAGAAMARSGVAVRGGGTTTPYGDDDARQTGGFDRRVHADLQQAQKGRQVRDGRRAHGHAVSAGRHAPSQADAATGAPEVKAKRPGLLRRLLSWGTSSRA